MNMRDHNFRLREDANAVSISVPRRFFQLISNPVRRVSSSSGPYIVSSQNGKADDRDGRKTTRLTTQNEINTTGAADTVVSGVKNVYSPQDARSDLHKKGDEKSGPNDAGVTGSPLAHQQQSQQNSPIKKKYTKKGGTTPKKPSGYGATTTDAISDASSTGTTAVAMDMSNGNSTKDAVAAITAPNAQESLELAIIEKPGLATFDKDMISTTEHPTLETNEVVVASESDCDHTKARPQIESITVTSSPLKTAETTSVVEQLTQISLDGKEQSIVSPSSHTSQSLVADDCFTTDAGSVAEPVEESTHTVPLLESPVDSNFPDQEVCSNAISPEIPSAKPTAPAIAVGSLSPTDSAKDPKSHETLFACPVKKSVVLSVADVPAKPGVQQVTSLHPYAKPSKYQQKKAREALRKQLKKEQAEKASNSKTKSNISNSLTKTNEAAVPCEDLVRLQHPPDPPVLRSEPTTRSLTRPAKAQSGVENTKPTQKANESFSQREGEIHKLTILADAAIAASNRQHEFHYSSNAAEPLIGFAQRAPMGEVTVSPEHADETMVRNDNLIKRNGSTVMNLQDTSHTPAPTRDAAELVSDDPATSASKKRSKNKRKKAKMTLVGEDRRVVEGANGKDDPITTECYSITHNAIDQVCNEPDPAGLVDRVRRGFGYGGV